MGRPAYPGNGLVAPFRIACGACARLAFLVGTRTPASRAAAAKACRAASGARRPSNASRQDCAAIRAQCPVMIGHGPDRHSSASQAVATARVLESSSLTRTGRGKRLSFMIVRLSTYRWARCDRGPSRRLAEGITRQCPSGSDRREGGVSVSREARVERDSVAGWAAAEAGVLGADGTGSGVARGGSLTPGGKRQCDKRQSDQILAHQTPPSNCEQVTHSPRSIHMAEWPPSKPRKQLLRESHLP